MRRRYPPERYVGIELEVNQRYVEAGGPAWPKIRRTLVETLGESLQLRAAAPVPRADRPAAPARSDTPPEPDSPRGAG